MVFEVVDVRVVLLDIEGTVCPISFVRDVLFPYALDALPGVLATQWDSAPFTTYRDAFPAEHRATPSAFTAHVQYLSQHDIKAPYLKALQGYLWTQGYASGDLLCPLFPDVAPALQRWRTRVPPLALVIYSSGSIAAQQLLFRHTDAGDLTPLLAAYCDPTTAGPKTEPSSYARIAQAHALAPLLSQWCFLSDNVAEVRAAAAAGMQAVVVCREGNVPLSARDHEELVRVHGFEEVRFGNGGSSSSSGEIKGKGEESREGR